MLTTISRRLFTSKPDFIWGIAMRYASGGNNNTNNTNNTNINDLFITSSNNQQQQIKNRAKKAKKGKKAKKAKKNFYEILGVEPSATKTEIKRAYYDLARTMHPDANPDDPNAAAAFNALSRAYHVLSDDVRRTAYDASGYNEEESRRADGSDTADLDGSAGLGPGGLSVYEQLVRGNVDAFGLGRLLRRITARGPTTTSSSSSSSSSGSEASGHRNAVTVTVPVTFAEAVAGVRKTVRAGLRVRCPRCGGAGEIVAQDEAPRPCRRCGGSGTAPGAKDISVPCRWCGGSGRMQPPRCGACRGSGARWARDARIAVNVPQGADDGDVVQVALPEELNALDAVFAQVAVVKKHPLFRRAGMDLHVDAPVSLTTAALGGSIKVPLLDGTHKSVRINPGTQSDCVKVIHGEGIKRQGSGRGDLVVHVRVITPASCSRKGRKLLMDYQAEEERSAKNSRWWKDSYKTWVKFLF